MSLLYDYYVDSVLRILQILYYLKFEEDLLSNDNAAVAAIVTAKDTALTNALAMAVDTPENIVLREAAITNAEIVY